MNLREFIGACSIDQKLIICDEKAIVLEYGFPQNIKENLDKRVTHIMATGKCEIILQLEIL